MTTSTIAIDRLPQRFIYKISGSEILPRFAEASTIEFQHWSVFKHKPPGLGLQSLWTPQDP
jgi:hypothetical protein